jgi:hypothetical protein
MDTGKDTESGTEKEEAAGEVSAVIGATCEEIPLESKVSVEPGKDCASADACRLFA